MQISLGGRLGRSSLESRRPPQSAEPYLHLSINLSQYYTVTRTSNHDIIIKVFVVLTFAFLLYLPSALFLHLDPNYSEQIL